MKTKIDPNNSSRKKREGLFVADKRWILRTLIAVILSLRALVVVAQSAVVSGRITDELGEPIPGVNVVVKGTTTGTGTDLQGRYSLNINGETIEVLLISAVGFDTQEISVGQRSVIDVQLKANLTELEEVVVTGYSTLMKKDISSSIAVVDVDDMKKVAASNIGDQLQGKVAGVQVSTSGEPGSVQYVRVRGIGTINNNEPLYVIDGVPVQNETNMNFLNPNDIESMQVLKDASASIYGARSANGVIVITTKKGKGASKLNFDFFTGFQDPYKFPTMATPDQIMQIEQASYAGAGQEFQSAFYLEKSPGVWSLPDFMVFNKGYPEGHPDVDPSKYKMNTKDPSQYSSNYQIVEANKGGTDWFDELYKPAPMLSAQLSVSGGTEKATHFFSVNYFDYQGILIRNKWQRTQVRLNNTYSVRRNIRIGENLNIAYQLGTGGNDLFFRNTQSAYTYPVIVPVYDINGYWAASSQTTIVTNNPVAEQNRRADGMKYHSLRITGNAFLEFDFLSGFTFRTNAGLDYFESPAEAYTYTCPECRGSSQVNRYSKSWSNKRSWVLTSTLNYNKVFGRHTFYGILGVEGRNAFEEGFNAAGGGLTFGDDTHYRELANAQSGSYSIGSGRSENKMLSAFANLNYTFDDKYIVALSVRTDGSSRFVNNKFGTFAGASAAWLISRESFFSGVKVLSELKLRASYGSMGNNEVVGGDYPGYSTWGSQVWFTTYAIDGSPNSFTLGSAQLTLGNPDLKWETSTLTNFAFDATLNNQFDITLEWYNRKTSNMIYGVPAPLERGIPVPVNQNIGSIVNRGLDLQLAYRGKIPSKKLTYVLGLTGTHYYNKVLALDANDNSFVFGANLYGEPTTRTQVGYPVSQLYGYKTDGLWQSQLQIDTVLYDDEDGVSGAKPGRMKFQDTDGNGRINSNDRTFIGNPLPKFILGLNINLNYNGFDVSAFVNGVFGNKIYNPAKPILDRQKRLEEHGETLPAFDISDNISYQSSDYFVEDGSYLRLRNVVLGYTIPNKAISRIGMTKARIYIQAQNLFTWTRYSGLDPDVTIANMYYGSQPQRDLTTGVDVGRYAPSRQYILGLNIEF